MNLANDLLKTVWESPKRMQIFRNIFDVNEKAGHSGLRPLCPRQWTLRASSMQQILRNYENLLNFLENFSEEDSTDATLKCPGYLKTMLHFKTFFFLFLYCHVMSPIEELNCNI